MNNKDFEPIRVRIMQEAYELADRNDSEGYNAIKVMCGDVQEMLPPKRFWVGLTDDEVEQLAVDAGIVTWVRRVYDDVDKKFYDLPLGEGMEGDEISLKQFANLVFTKLKDKNI